MSTPLQIGHARETGSALSLGRLKSSGLKSLLRLNSGYARHPASSAKEDLSPSPSALTQKPLNF
jgi:hypothetical protein